MQGEALKGHLDLLLLVSLEPRPAHGYAVVEMLRKRSAGTFDLPEGTLYPALHRLEDSGLVTSRWTEESGRRRRCISSPRKGGGTSPPGGRWSGAPLRVQSMAWWRMAWSRNSSRRITLKNLGRELRKHGVFGTRFMEETRGHLTDAIEAGRRGGLTQEAAEEAAIGSFGDAREVAAKYAAHKYRTLHWVLLIAAIGLGLAIAWVANGWSGGKKILACRS